MQLEGQTASLTSKSTCFTFSSFCPGSSFYFFAERYSFLSGGWLLFAHAPTEQDFPLRPITEARIRFRSLDFV